MLDILLHWYSFRVNKACGLRLVLGMEMAQQPAVVLGAFLR